MKLAFGVDVGSRSTKGVLLDVGERQVLARAVLATGHDLGGAARQMFDGLLQQTGLGEKDVAYVASTGFGRYQVDFRQIQITEITCHARGAAFRRPDTRTVLDMGAQNTRAMRVGPGGRVLQFRVNDKCASGAGRFLERAARALEVDLEQVGDLSLRSRSPTAISSICAVLAESEIINLVTEGSRIEDILAGAHLAITDRVSALVRQVGGEAPLTLTGGVSRNAGMVKALEQRLGMPVTVPEDAEFLGALGAALLGGERLNRAGPLCPSVASKS